MAGVHSVHKACEIKYKNTIVNVNGRNNKKVRHLATFFLASFTSQLPFFIQTETHTDCKDIHTPCVGGQRGASGNWIGGVKET